MARRKVRYIWWREILSHCCSRRSPTFTAAEIARENSITEPGASQVLSRMQAWGILRHVGFAPPAGGEAGRRRKVYEVTEGGRARAAYQSGRTRRSR